MHRFAINYQKELGEAYGLVNGVHMKPETATVTQPSLLVRICCLRAPLRVVSIVAASAHVACTLSCCLRCPHPPLGWVLLQLQYVDALDKLLAQMKDAGFPFASVAAVSGSGQQHGSVYLARGAREALRGLKQGATLKDQLKGEAMRG